MPTPTRPIAPDPTVARRSFMARLGAGLAALGLGASAVGAMPAGDSPAGSAPWTPTRHPQDDWLDSVPGKHRFYFDVTSATGTGEGIAFVSNFLNASKSGYGLDDRDNAVILGLRHFATAFAFSDAIWAKYGGPLGERIGFKDPKTATTPVINVYQTTGYGPLLPNREQTLSMMVARGVHFALCDMATRAYAGVIAQKLGLRSGDVYEELKASALPNSHFMAAGIVAVNRAHERGYAIQHIG
jgi:hypothetical protein